MFARVTTVAFEGIEARPIDVQVQIGPGMPHFTIVGLPDKAVADKPGATPAKPDPAKKSPVAEAVPPSGTAVIGFTILPWGEVYVDGQMRGVAPPLREVEVKPGRHRIEIRNADFQPYVEVVDAKPGSRIRIRHRFR